MTTIDSHNEVEQAKRDGCKPVWADGILGWQWHCSCDDNRHGCGSQCSAIVPRGEQFWVDDVVKGKNWWSCN